MFAFSKCSLRNFLLHCVVLLYAAGIVLSLPVISGDKSSDNLISDLDRVEDNGSVENALMNYLFAKEFVNRMRHQLDARDLLRKRSYWKQCAFNAVSCFG